MTDMNPAALQIEDGWLVEQVSHCTCGGPGPNPGDPHEGGCGLEPVILLTDLAELLHPEPALPAGIDLDLLAQLTALVLNDCDHDGYVSADDVGLHLPGFIATVLRGRAGR